MTSPLQPEIRPDKNGKLVTRHLRQGNAVSSGISRVAAPAIKSEADEEAEQELIGKLIRVTNEDWLLGEGVKRWETLKRVRSLPSSTVRAISDKLDRAASGTYFGYVVAFALHEQQDVDVLENMTFFYSDDHYDHVLDYGADHMYKVLKEDLRGLDIYPQLTPGTNYMHSDKAEQGRAKVLFELLVPADETDGLKVISDPVHGNGATALKDEALVELALENSDNYVKFLDLVDERGMNVDTLREILSTTAPLWEGAL